MTDVTLEIARKVDCALTASAPAVRGSHWRTVAITASFTIVAVCFFWWQTISLLVQEWRTRTYSHGFIILPVCLYLLWRRRHWIAQVEPRAEFFGIAAALCCALGWLAGRAGDARVIQEFCLIGMIVSALWSIVGTRALRRMALPLAFLIFAVPIGDSLISPLQDFTAAFAAAALRLSGIPTFTDGRLLSIPTADWQVAEACSGINYLISMVFLACLFAVTTYRTWWRRALFLAASIAIPILANGIRAYGIVMLAYLSNNRLAVGVDHIIYGWVFFALVILLLFAVAGRWQEPKEDLSTASIISSDLVSIQRFPVPTMLTCSALSVILAGVVAIAPSLLWVKNNPGLARAVGPHVSAPWRATLAGDWQPVITSEAEFTNSYSGPSGTVNVFIHRYDLNSTGVALASSSNPVLAGADTTIWKQQLRTVSVNKRTASINEDIGEVGSGRRLIWSWYTVAGVSTAQPYKVKLLQAKARLLGHDSQGQISVISIPLRDLTADRNLLQQFLNSARF